MIKQIVYCDRCGEECEFIINTLGYELQEDHKKLDLCQDCYNSLNRWLKKVSLAEAESNEG